MATFNPYKEAAGDPAMQRNATKRWHRGWCRKCNTEKPMAGGKTSGIKSTGDFKIRRRKACQFESGRGHHVLRPLPRLAGTHRLQSVPRLFRGLFRICCDAHRAAHLTRAAFRHPHAGPGCG